MEDEEFGEPTQAVYKERCDRIVGHCGVLEQGTYTENTYTEKESKHRAKQRTIGRFFPSVAVADSSKEDSSKDTEDEVMLFYAQEKLQQAKKQLQQAKLLFDVARAKQKKKSFRKPTMQKEAAAVVAVRTCVVLMFCMQPFFIFCLFVKKN